MFGTASGKNYTRNDKFGYFVVSEAKLLGIFWNPKIWTINKICAML